MSRSLSNLARISQNASNTKEVWLILLRIWHASITPGGVLRFVNDNQDMAAGGSDGQTYTAFPFTLDLPGEDMDSPSVAKLRIDNVDQRIVQAIRGLPSAPTCDFEVVIASQPTTVELGLNGLTLRNVSFDTFIVEGSINFEEIFTEPVTLEMTPARFPGMF
jgi:hypothetical protein